MRVGRIFTHTLLPFAVLFWTALSWAAAPHAEISNGTLRVQLYLPDTGDGFYRGTRFDWSGVIGDLQFQGHHFYGPWFSKTDPKVHDFIYDGPDIIASPCSAATGPVEEFAPALGYEDAKAGGTFVKVGVGVLRKPDDGKYDSGRLYEIVDSGKWKVTRAATSIAFRQEIHDPYSGYGYVYTKTVSLIKGKAEMVIEHHLKNTGTRPIHISTYDHNFLVLDKETPSPAFTITFPFKVAMDKPGNEEFVKTQSNQVVYLKTLENKDRVYTGIQGFGGSVDDNKIRIENSRAGVGMTISGDRPLAKVSLWSIRSVLAVEPFVEVTVETGGDLHWNYQYAYYALPRLGKD